MRLDVATVQLNGNTGTFRKVIRSKDGIKTEDLGPTVDIVILRIRRQLTEFKNEKFNSTSEHNHPNDTVLYFPTQEKMSSKDLRVKYTGLRTQQILYALLNNELVRVVVKGASLGSKNKPEDSMPFYEYLNQYEKDEHIWQYMTSLQARPEKGKLGKYFAIHFEQGQKLPNTATKKGGLDLSVIGAKMKVLHEIFESQDNWNKIKEKESEVLPVVQIEESLGLESEPSDDIDASELFA